MRWAVLVVLSGCSRILGIEDFEVRDAGTDSGSGFCLGREQWQVCTPTEPTETKSFSSPVTINTDLVGPCSETQPVGWEERQPGACFIIASEVIITKPVRAEGARPLVIFAAKTIRLSADIDVAGHRLGNVKRPAGANSEACKPFTTATTSANGGAGGSFVGSGGNGGSASAGGGVRGLAAAPEPALPVALRAGCGGGDGAAPPGGNGGAGGSGGGAVYLVAGNQLVMNDVAINASGAAGGGGINPGGGGGGGSGGMIVVYAPTISGPGRLIANGGGGGSGGGGNEVGMAGAEAVTTDLAAPPGGPATGANGRGGAGFPASLRDGADASIGGALSGGGGGGGGEGLILTSPSSLMSSPVAIKLP